MAKRYDKEWLTGNEIAFLKTLSDEKLQQYKNAMPLRANWGKINQTKIREYIEEKLSIKQ